MPTTAHRDVAEPAADRPFPTDPRALATTGLIPGMVVAATGIAAAYVAHRFVGQIGVLTWAVVLGVVLANLDGIPAAAAPGLRVVTRRMLRFGVVLLGFSLPLSAIVALGPSALVAIVLIVTLTFAGTYLLGARLRIPRPRRLLIATGFSICGASAIAAMEANSDGDDDDVATAIAMVTICGTALMVLLPLVRGPLGLTDHQYGFVAGASVHEVGQVVAAATPAGAAALGVAIVAKLTRVLLLAPVVAIVSVARRHAGRDEVAAGGADSNSPQDGTGANAAPALVPMFVIAFVCCVVLRSVLPLGPGLLSVIQTIQTVALGAALFALGTGVRVRSLLRGSGSVLILSAASTALVLALSLAAVVLIG